MPRRYHAASARWRAALRSFNEAGAFAPEIWAEAPVEGHDIEGFNEAGAFAPEISCGWSKAKSRFCRFNEAGAFAPEISHDIGKVTCFVKGLQ